MSTAALTRLVFANEIARLVRDRRAVFTAIVLPILLYPVLIFGMDHLERASQERLAERGVRVGVALTALDPAIAERIERALADPALAVELVHVAPDDRRVRGAPGDGAAGGTTPLEGLDALLVGRAAEPPGTGRPTLELRYEGSRTLSQEALDRVRTPLRRVAEDRSHELLLAAVGADPGAGFVPVERDLARAEDAAGKRLGRLLPLFAILILVSGGSLAALDAFAGEREAGTLETLLVQPVPARAIAAGKFLAVLATSLVALLGNAGSFAASVGLGLDVAEEGVAGAAVSPLRLALGLLLLAPLAVVVAALLSLLSARARSFREGQHYLFPLVLGSMALAAPSVAERVELTPLLAVVPVTGSALALRDALTGSLAPLPALLSVASASALAAALLRRLARTLDAERLLAQRLSAEEAAARGEEGRRAVRSGIAAVLIVYLAGGFLQGWRLVPGLALTLWVVVPGLALWIARGVARRTGEPLGRVLGLERPRTLDLLAAVSLAPALAVVTARLFALQSRVLPVPELAVPSELASLGTSTLVLLLALSPGWNEELLFRGALFGGMRRDLPPRRVVAAQGLLFGAVHASLHRFVPTALAGAALAAIRLRVRGLLPAVLLHAAYNGILILRPIEPRGWNELLWLALALPGILWLRSPFAGSRP